MRHREVIIAFTALIAGLAGCGSPAGSGRPESALPGLASDGTQGLPAGWRWESYGGVEVGVPGDWGWGNSTQRISQWCVADSSDAKEPMVGRPGVATLVGCTLTGGPSPETLVDNTGHVVGFDRIDDLTSGVERVGDRTTVRLRGVQVVVQALEPLRRQIVATVHAVDGVDSHGCPVEHPIAAQPRWRPSDPVNLTTLTAVSAVSACRYETDKDRRGLMSALRLSGAAAAAAVQQAAKAPIGGGPNNPQDCSPEVQYGNEVIVLRVQSAAGVDEVVLRYAGCDHQGFDDGTSVRTLTAGAVAPFVTGPNLVGDISSTELLDILQPQECPVPAPSGGSTPADAAGSKGC